MPASSRFFFVGGPPISHSHLHKKKIEKAIKDGIKDVVAEESIIGQNGKKKIKIPVKGLKEFRFIYGDNEHNKQAGSAGDKEIKKGQGLSHRRKKP